MKTLLKRLLAAAFLGVAGFMGLNWVMEGVLHSREEVVVPSLSGKSVVDALEMLSKSKLTLVQESIEFDESFPPGAILRQRPAPGMKVREGRAVRVVVSKGGQALFVPDIAGKSLSDAQTAIAQAGLALGEVSEVYSTLVKRGLVVSQIPPTGEVASRGTLVDMGISKGPPPPGVLLMPDFRSRSVEEPRAWAAANGFALAIQESTSTASGLSGLVLEQGPPPDELLQTGAQLRVLITPLRAEAGAGSAVNYEVPRGSERAEVRMVARDERGEREIFRGERNPGDIVNVPLVPMGPTRVRIFLNGVLVDERILGQ